MWQASFKPLGIPQWKKKIPTLKGKWSNLRFLANPHLDVLNSWCLQLNMSKTKSVISLPPPPKYSKIPGPHQRSPSWEMAPYPSRDWIGNLATAASISSIWSIFWSCWLYRLNFTGIHLLLPMSTATWSRPRWSPPWTGRMDALTRPAWFSSQRDLLKIHLPVHHSPAHNTSMASCCIWTQRHLFFPLILT